MKHKEKMSLSKGDKVNIPKDLNYTKTHEWVKVTGNIARVGISDFAQRELTDIVFAELPQEGAEINAGKQCAVVESVKTAADIYAPVSGRVVKVNQSVVEAPELINSDPYGEGWLFEVEMSQADETNDLLTVEEYREIAGEK